LGQAIADGFNAGAWDSIDWADPTGQPWPAGKASADRWLGMVRELTRFTAELEFKGLDESAPSDGAPTGGARNVATARYSMTWRCFPRGVAHDDEQGSTILDTWVRLVETPENPEGEGGSAAPEGAATTGGAVGGEGAAAGGGAASAGGDFGGWRAVWSTVLLAGDVVDDAAELVETRQRAARGRIMAADGTALVEDRGVVDVGVNKPLVTEGTDPGDVARQLAEVLEIDPGAYADKVAAAGPQAFVPALTLRDGEAGAYDFTEFGQAVLVQAGTLPLAPSRQFARALLGVAGEATAEIVDASEGAIEPGDVVGLSGMQRTYDELLRGTAGATLRIVPPEEGDAGEGGEGGGGGAGGGAETDPADANPPAGTNPPAGADQAGEQPPDQTTPTHPEIELVSIAPRAGRDVVITLDAAIQDAADNALVAAGQVPAALVAVRPSTGALVAVANSTATEGVNIALDGRYPPGSVFKVVTALAMIRQGMNPDTPVNCPGSLDVDGRQFGNYSGYPRSGIGQITLGRAFALSCNTAFLGAAGSIPQAALWDAAADLGVGAGMPIGVDAFAGDVPAEADGTEHAAEMIGQGHVLVTPAVMAVVAASVQAGARVTPTLVTDPPNAGSDYAQAPSGLTPEEAAILRAMMRQAVTNGTADFLEGLPGEVGGKTGTAEFGSATPPETHAWTIATDPSNDLAVAVIVEGGASGGEVAGPVVANFLELVGGQASPPPAG
jgi:cell division protein FtsI/penicillin-binding protein 2